MPLYEYRCSDCSHQIEVLQPIGGDAEGMSCPQCGSAALERQLSTFAGRSSSSSADTACATPGCGSPFT